MRDADVVVLSRFPEIFEGFRKSVDADAPEAKKICVWDAATTEFPDLRFPWSQFRMSSEFQIAKYANAGWKAVMDEPDILYAGDDTRIIEPETIYRLRVLAEINPEVGILAPRIKEQDNQHAGTMTVVPFVPFVFVLIKREVIDKVGYMDERFVGYGLDDLDYCYRARLAGFKIAYVNDVWIQHGVGEHKWGSTFKRVKTEEQRIAEDRANWTRFAEKYGFPDDQAKRELYS